MIVIERMLQIRLTCKLRTLEIWNDRPEQLNYLCTPSKIV